MIEKGLMNSEFNTQAEYEAHKNYVHAKIVSSSPRITVKHKINDLLKQLRSEYILDEKSITLALLDVLETQAKIIVDVSGRDQ